MGLIFSTPFTRKDEISRHLSLCLLPTLCELSHGTGGGVLNIMNDRIRMAIDPRIPTMPGRSTSGVHRPGRQLRMALLGQKKSGSQGYPTERELQHDVPSILAIIPFVLFFFNFFVFVMQ